MSDRAPLPSDPEHAVAFLKRKLASLFPDDVDRIADLCVLRQKLSFPLGYWHTELLIEFSGAQNIPCDTREDLATGYILLCSYYFLLDATIDGHLISQTDPAYLTHMLSGGLHFIRRPFVVQSDKFAQRDIQLINEYISENASAICTERELREHGTAEQLVSDNCDVGRSNTFILLYCLVCLLGDAPMSQQAAGIALLKDYVVLRQRLDDLGDWREDFRREHRTPFLWKQLSGVESYPSEADLEQALYLTGAYESEIVDCIRQIDAISAKVSREFSSAVRFIRTLKDERQLATDSLKNWIAAKLSFLKTLSGTSSDGQVS